MATGMARRIRLRPRSMIFLLAGTVLLSGRAQSQSPPLQPAANAQIMPGTAPQVAAVDVNAPAAVTYTPALRFTPSAEISERYTDNAALSPDASARTDWVSNLGAGLKIDYRAARLNAQLDYRLNRLIYNRAGNLNDTQHFLNSRATLEAVEKWLYVDARASITQQNRSIFGATSVADIPSANANRIETTTYQLSPYIRGHFGDIAIYQLRVNEAQTRTGDVLFPQTRTREWTGFVKSAPSAGWLGWSVDGNSLAVDNGSSNQDDSRVRASLTAEIDSQFHLSVSGGRESSNLDGLQRRNLTSYGFGVEWAPSPRTQFAAVTQKRFFGNDHLVAFSHRTALTEWRLASSREVAVSTNEVSSAAPISVSSLLLDLLASSVPDPATRAEAARQKFLQTGMPDASGIQSSFLTSRPFLNRQHQASVALLGLRNTITIDLGVREQRAFDTTSATSSVAAPIEQVRQYNANATWAYRLSRVSTLRLVVSHLRTRGLILENLSSTQRLQSLFLVTQLGPRTSVSLGVQRILFDSTVVNNYRENAIVGTLTVRY